MLGLETVIKLERCIECKRLKGLLAEANRRVQAARIEMTQAAEATAEHSSPLGWPSLSLSLSLLSLFPRPLVCVCVCVCVFSLSLSLSRSLSLSLSRARPPSLIQRSGDPARFSFNQQPVAATGTIQPVTPTAEFDTLKAASLAAGASLAEHVDAHHPGAEVRLSVHKFRFTVYILESMIHLSKSLLCQFQMSFDTVRH